MVSSTSPQLFLTPPLQKQWLTSARSLLLSKQRVSTVVGRNTFWALELHKHWLLVPSLVKLSNEIYLIGSLWQLSGLACIKYLPVSEVSNYCFHFPLLFYFLIKIRQLINIIARLKLRHLILRKKTFYTEFFHCSHWNVLRNKKQKYLKGYLLLDWEAYHGQWPYAENS